MPDVVVDLARPAERAGEQDPQHVQDDRGDEQVAGRPVDAPEEQPAGHVVGQPDDRLERRGQLPAVEQRRGAPVDDGSVDGR
jgi:hypothetical protein